MPIHDWSCVYAGLFQDFRSSWSCAISKTLNGGVLPNDYYALLAPAALTIDEIVAAPGSVPFRQPWLEGSTDDEMEFYRRRKGHIVVRRAGDHAAAAVLDIVSAGDKASRAAVQSFVERITGLIRRGVGVLICDVLPPGVGDPHGIYKAIGDEFLEEDFAPPPNKALTLVSYAPEKVAYVELVAVGDMLPDMPLFLEPGAHVLVPLETTYRDAFAAVPRRWKRVLEASDT